MSRHHLSHPTETDTAVLNRRRLVTDLLEKRGDSAIVSSLGASCWDLAAGGDVDLNFYVWGAMGSTCMVALGIALAQPNRRIVALVGDGEMLMGMSSLATIGAVGPSNLAVLVLDNEQYGDTGNQPTHTAVGADLEGVAKAAGFQVTATMRSERETIHAGDMLFNLAGPVFLVAKVTRERAPMILPPRDGGYLKHRMRRALIGDAALT